VFVGDYSHLQDEETETAFPVNAEGASGAEQRLSGFLCGLSVIRSD
jgi:hypothetical protein